MNPPPTLPPPDPAARRRQLHRRLGDLPAVDGPPVARVVRQSDGEGYCLEALVLDLNGVEPVPAYLTLPAHGGGPYPVVLYNHAHGGDYTIGKEELIHGRGALQAPPYAAALASRGIAALCIDHWAFGERRGRRESEIFKEMLWRGQCLWGMMVFDSLRAIDYLESRSDIDTGRLATVGISMGSTMAWWVAALDPRVKLCIDLCCLTDFDALIAQRGLDGHGVYYFVPGLLKEFTTARINALIAPRPHLSLAGIYDLLTPPDGLERIDRELRDVYAAAGAPEAWHLHTEPCGHLETIEMRQLVMQWIDRWL